MTNRFLCCKKNTAPFLVKVMAKVSGRLMAKRFNSLFVANRAEIAKQRLAGIRNFRREKSTSNKNRTSKLATSVRKSCYADPDAIHRLGQDACVCVGVFLLCLIRSGNTTLLCVLRSMAARTTHIHPTSSGMSSHFLAK